MCQDHPVETLDEIDALLEQLKPHIDAVNLATEITSEMQISIDFAEMDGGRASEFGKRLIVLRENDFFTKEQHKKILLRHHLTSTKTDQSPDEKSTHLANQYQVIPSNDPLSKLLAEISQKTK